MNEEIASLAMNLIFSSGNAKSTAIQAIRKAEEDMPEAKKTVKRSAEPASRRAFDPDQTHAG